MTGHDRSRGFLIARFESRFGLDQHFFNSAKQSRKTILALETAGFQINVLAGLPEAGQIKALEGFLADPTGTITQTVALVESWKRGDADGIQEKMETELGQDRDAIDQLLVQRNNNWLPLIEEYLDGQKTTLVIVGAAHLVGEYGLVNLLRNQGYDVEQLPRAAEGIPGISRPRCHSTSPMA